MVWKKPYLSSECRTISKQTRNEWRDVDERTTYVPSLQYIFNMWTVSSDVSTKRRYWQPLSVHLWASYTHPTHDVNDVMCEGWPQHRGLRPLLFSNSGVGSFTSHKNRSVKVLWDGTYGFSSLSEKTRKSNHLQMSLQRQHFLLSYLKTLWLLVWPGFEPVTSRSADRRSPNWANQAAGTNLDVTSV